MWQVGAAPLTWDNDLEAIAIEWAETLAARPGYCALGKLLTHRSEEDNSGAAWYKQPAYVNKFGGAYIGENIFATCVASSLAFPIVSSIFSAGGMAVFVLG